jgi:hypothetical protein
MGLKYGHQYTYLIRNLDLRHVYNVALAQMIRNNDDNNKRNPTIDIDCSLIIFKEVLIIFHKM